MFDHLYALDGPPGPIRKVVLFRVGSVNCIIDIMNVREIVLPVPTAAFPGRDDSVVGVVDHRQTAIPVVDMRRRLGVPPGDDKKTKWIIAHNGERLVALVVDKVDGVVDVDDRSQRDLKSLAGSTDVSFAQRAFGSAHGLVFELDLASIGSETREGAL